MMRRVITFLMLMALLVGLLPVQPALSSSDVPAAQPAESTPRAPLNIQALRQALYQEAAPGTACYSLDVVFLIDQSGSMSGAGGVLASDPTEQRKNAVLAVIDILSDIALDRCPQAYHRLAMISYGTQAQIDLGLSNINPTTADEAARIRDELKRNVDALDLYETHPLEAFILAKQVWNEAAVPPEGGDRKKVIIFITDGIPYPIPSGAVDYANQIKKFLDQNFPFDGGLLAEERCLDELRARYPGAEELPPEERVECLKISQDPVAYEQSTYLWMILLKSSQAYPRGLTEIYKEMAEDRAGELIELTQNYNDIPTTFRRIIEELSGVKSALLQCGKFAVNPYLRKVKLNVYKIDPELKINVSYVDAGGATHEISSNQQGSTGGFDVEEYYEYGANERYVLRYPYPGLWNLTADNCEGLDVYYEETVMQVAEKAVGDLGQIAQFDREPYYDDLDKKFLQFTITDETGREIVQEDFERFAIDFKVKVTQPDGQPHEYKAVWNSGGRYFELDEPLRVPLPGNYTYEVTGSTHYRSAPPVPLPASEDFAAIFPDERELFSKSGYSFSVFPVIPFDLEITYPPDGQPLPEPVHGDIREGWPLVVHPVSVRARIFIPSGEPHGLDQILENPNAPLQAVLSSGGTSKTLALLPDPAVPGGFHGTFEGFDTPGDYDLSVTLQSGFTRQFRPLHREDATSFSRVEGTWTVPGPYYTILFVLLAALGLFILYNILIRTNRVRGVLVFCHTGGSEIATFSLSSGKNWKVIGPKALNQYPQLDLKKIKASMLGRGRRRKVKAEEDVLAAIDGFADPSSQAGVRLQFTTTAGRRFTQTVQAGMPEPFSSMGEDNLLQIEYRQS